jgi:dUTP pyrophosphatase
MSTFANTELEHLRLLFPEFMILKIYIDSENTNLKDLYVKEIEKHNKHLLDSPDQYNSGFDLFVTDVESVGMGNMKKINFRVSCCAKLHRIYGSTYTSSNTGFYMYARSSISKTELRIANNVGIIDSGYRGNIMGLFDVVPMEDRYDSQSRPVEFGNRITQICSPGLQPIYVVLVGSMEELGETIRGDGGFGSTGR